MKFLKVKTERSNFLVELSFMLQYQKSIKIKNTLEHSMVNRKRAVMYTTIHNAVSQKGIIDSIFSIQTSDFVSLIKQILNWII